MTGRSFFLEKGDNPLQYEKQALKNAIKTKKMGHPLYFYPETDTTNDRATLVGESMVRFAISIRGEEK